MHTAQQHKSPEHCCRLVCGRQGTLVNQPASASGSRQAPCSSKQVSIGSIGYQLKCTSRLAESLQAVPIPGASRSDCSTAPCGHYSHMPLGAAITECVQPCFMAPWHAEKPVSGTCALLGSAQQQCLSRSECRARRAWLQRAPLQGTTVHMPPGDAQWECGQSCCTVSWHARKPVSPCAAT